MPAAKTPPKKLRTLSPLGSLTNHPSLQIPYRCVEVNPLTKSELKWSEYRKVPVVVIDGEQVRASF